MVIANAGTAWITNLSPYIVRLSFSMWHPAYPMGAFAYDKSAARPRRWVYRLPARPGFDRCLQNRLREGRRQDRDCRSRSARPVQVPDFTPFFQRIKDAHPDCMYVFIPSGAHATGVMKAYGELGMRKAGIKLIGPMDLVPDNELQDMGDAAIGPIVMSTMPTITTRRATRNSSRPGTRLTVRTPIPTSCRPRAWMRWRDLRRHQHAQRRPRRRRQGHRHPQGLEARRLPRPDRDRSADPRRHPGRARRGSDQEARRQARRKVLETIPQVKDECKVLKLGRCAS